MKGDENLITIKDKLYFNYDGVDSREFGITAVNMGSGLYEDTFVATRNIEETSPKNRYRNIFHGISEEDRSFDLILSFDEGYSDELLERVNHWIFKRYYRPMYFDGNRDRVVFAMPTGTSSIFHNGMKQGYFTVSMKTNSPYVFSDIKRMSFSEGEQVFINNSGHEISYPHFKIKKVGDGDLKIKVENYNVLMVDLINGETIEIDTMREKVITDIPGVYRYDNLRIGEFSDLALEVGGSNFISEGGAEIECEYREVYRF